MTYSTVPRALQFLRSNPLKVTLRRHSIRQYTPSNFYSNRELEQYASREAKRLTLRQLVFFGRSLNADKILKSANYVRTELPVRISHRLRDLQALPYVVVTQEGVDKVYELYWLAFEKFRQYPEITTLAENQKFCEFLQKLLDIHATVIPNLSLGLSLSSKFLSPDRLDSFMRRMLVSRISRRVLAEHHVALTRSFTSQQGQESDEPHVGIIYTGLNVKHSVERCTSLLRSRPPEVEHMGKIDSWPEVITDGHLDAQFPYIREHLEYIVFELLKNAMHATILKHYGKGPLPAIRVTVVAGENDIGLRISDQGGGLFSGGNTIENSNDLCSFSHVRNASRLEDQRIVALRTATEEGIRATVEEQVTRWKNPSSQLEKGKPVTATIEVSASLPRIGIGLPMSKIFATYFGGSLELVSLDGWGTDVYLRLPKLGTNLEDIEL
ncbi:branched-chain alpha-ketoacid dehydrogenase [Ephemerocybe angulata]|uniref:Protein-serine/threonine kinase n=1 Tax=Ephemerocybe angulata TaxID=980116 RepID=A0A8H6IBV6_9AGAR|nr:branched-chain alpha-ketoacid dehydrogenase [Tulosesus angulatus]